MSSEKYNNDKTYYPSWFNRMTLKETHNEYNVFEYINLLIYTTPDNKYFNATRLMKLLSEKVRNDGTKSSSKSMTSLMGSKKWQMIQKQHPNLFKVVKGRYTQKYKGVYLQWILFSSFIGYASAGADINFELGEIIDESTEGYIYMCIPDKCDGTDTVKFGRTWNWNQRVSTYGNNTDLLYLLKVPDMYLAEEKMLKYMSALFPCDTNFGDEYFIIKSDEDLIKAINYFDELCKEDGVVDVSDEY